MKHPTPQLHPKRPRALGLDFGKVIMCPPSGLEGDDTRFLTVPEDEALAIPPPEGAFEVIAALVSAFEGRVYIVSKAGPRIASLTQKWLDAHRFFDITGVSPRALHFCRERREKRDHAFRLRLTHFVDDRVDVLTHLTANVPYRYLFGPQHLVPRWAIHVADWQAVRREILGGR